MKPIGFRIFEDFGDEWKSYRIDAEAASEWTALPALANLEFGYPITPRSTLAVRMGLRRDVGAWLSDEAGGNIPLSDKELDLNEPSLGYYHFHDDHFDFTIGRFPVHWSPSPDYGLALSRSVPYHNGAEFAVRMPRVTYRFLVSSLNPWLEGTPVGESSGENYPIGSEEYRQRHYEDRNSAGNFHKRVYAERSKTLFAHRLEGSFGWLSAGITETQIIGGKVPDFRDAGPFVTFHNDFKDGYTNGALSLDAAIRLPGGFALTSEYYIDDIEYPATEGDGSTASLQGYIAGLRHAFSARGWTFRSALHGILTDPFLYGYVLPMNTMASRHILSSNRQYPDDSLFVDKYVIDYPMGYVRGGDAVDLRYRFDAWRGATWHAALTADWLQQGEADLASPYGAVTAGSDRTSPSGTAQREVRVAVSVDHDWKRRIRIHARAGWQGTRNQRHLRGDSDNRAIAGLGLSWSLPL